MKGNVVKTLFAITVLLLLAGCSTVPYGPNLSADQINAMVKDKASTAFCVVSPTGIKIVYVNLDETKVNGTIVVDPSSCGVSMTTTTPPKTPPVTVTK